MAARNCSHNWWAEPGVEQPVHPERHTRSGRCRVLQLPVVAITCPVEFRWPQPYSSMPGSPKMPEQQAAEEAGDAVGVDDPEGVVHLGEGPHLGEEVPGHPDDGRADRIRSRWRPVPLTHPAQGVIPTRPQIMPFTAPRKVGFFSLDTQASRPPR